MLLKLKKIINWFFDIFYLDEEDYEEEDEDDEDIDPLYGIVVGNRWACREGWYGFDRRRSKYADTRHKHVDLV